MMIFFPLNFSWSCLIRFWTFSFLSSWEKILNLDLGSLIGKGKSLFFFFHGITAALLQISLVRFQWEMFQRAQIFLHIPNHLAWLIIPISVCKKRESALHSHMYENQSNHIQVSPAKPHVEQGESCPFMFELVFRVCFEKNKQRRKENEQKTMKGK